INPVQIQLDDFLLSEMIFDALGEEDLQQLATVCSFFERETVARQLLCDGAAALPHMTCSQVFQRCANDTQQIIAVMFVKFCVLDGNNSINRSEEHTSELQSQSNLVCRLLLEKKKTYSPNTPL